MRRQFDYRRTNDNNLQTNNENSRAFNVTRERALYNQFAQPYKDRILQQCSREPNDAENLEIQQAYQAYRVQAQAKYLQEERSHSSDARLPEGEIPIVRPSPRDTNFQQRDTSPLFANPDLNRYITFLRDLQQEQEWISNTLAKISPGLLVSIASEIDLMSKKRIIDADRESRSALRLNIKKVIDYKQRRGVTLQEVIAPFKEIQYVIETLVQSLLEIKFIRNSAYLSNMNRLIEICKN